MGMSCVNAGSLEPIGYALMTTRYTTRTLHAPAVTPATPLARMTVRAQTVNLVRSHSMREHKRSVIQRLLKENAKFTPEKGMERWLTGYSDASYKQLHPMAGGGWGCWVRDSTTRILRSGPCPEWVSDSQDAELCGVFSAVHTALTRLDAEWANIMVVKLDNQGVARWFGWQGTGSFPRKTEQQDLVCRALQAANAKGVRLIVTWVKGHRGTRDTAAYLNTQVDEMAGVARRNRQHTVKTMVIHGSKPSVCP